MVLFIDNAEYTSLLGGCLASCFRSALDVDPIQNLAWLYLLHDILSNIEHNRHGMKYKGDFENHLPAVFGSLGKICNVAGIGNAKLRRFKEGVSSIIDNWNHLGMYDITILQRITRIFNGVENLRSREVLPPPNKGMQNALADKNKKHQEPELASLPPSIQKSVLQARVTSESKGDADDDDIDGVPLYDTRWKPKDQKL